MNEVAKKKTPKLTIDIDEQLKKDFKILCAQEDTTMTDEVIAFIKSRLEADRKRKGNN